MPPRSKENSEDNNEPRALTSEEIEAIRAMIENDARIAWLWSTAKTWATWIAAIGLAITVGSDFLKKLLSSILKS